MTGLSVRESSMSTKLLSALFFSMVLFVPGVALADPPDHCTPIFEPGSDQDPPIDVSTAGQFNQAVKDEEGGPPGQQVIQPGDDVDPTDPTGPGASAFAQDRNADRKASCGPEKKT